MSCYRHRVLPTGGEMRGIGDPDAQRYTRRRRQLFLRRFIDWDPVHPKKRQDRSWKRFRATRYR